MTRDVTLEAVSVTRRTVSIEDVVLPTWSGNPNGEPVWSCNDHVSSALHRARSTTDDGIVRTARVMGRRIYRPTCDICPYVGQDYPAEWALGDGPTP